MEEVIRLHDRTGELFILTQKTVVKMGVTPHDREVPVMAEAVFIKQGLHAGHIGKVVGFRGEHEVIVKAEQFHGLVEIEDPVVVPIPYLRYVDVSDEHRLQGTPHVNPPLVHLCSEDCDDHDLFGDSDYDEYGVYWSDWEAWNNGQEEEDSEDEVGPLINVD